MKFESMMVASTAVATFMGSAVATQDPLKTPCAPHGDGLRLERFVDMRAATAHLPTPFADVQGIHIQPETPNTAYLASAFNFGLLELDLELGTTVVHPTANSMGELLVPDDVTGIGADLYFTSLVNVNPATFFTGQGMCSSCRGGVYKVATDGPAAWQPTPVWTGAVGEDILINPIAADTDGFLYTATSLAGKTNLYGMTFDGALKDDAPGSPLHYAPKLFKINPNAAGTAEDPAEVWQVEVEGGYFLNAFDTRDGYLYAGGSKGGSATETPLTFEGGDFALLRIDTATGQQVEQVLSFPQLSSLNYIFHVKFAGDRLYLGMDREWVVDYNPVTQAVEPETLRLAYDFAAHEPQIRVRDANDAWWLYGGAEHVTVLDNAVPHPDGKHLVISGSDKVFTMRLPDVTGKMCPVPSVP